MMMTPAETFGSLSADALDRFVYIVGMARGGTTVVRDAIDVHDQVLVLPGMTHFMNQVWRYRKRVHQRLLNQIFRLPAFYREESGVCKQTRGFSISGGNDVLLPQSQQHFIVNVETIVATTDRKKETW